MAVNRYEAHEMNEILRGLLQGAYMFTLCFICMCMFDLLVDGTQQSNSEWSVK